MLIASKAGCKDKSDEDRIIQKQ